MSETRPRAERANRMPPRAERANRMSARLAKSDDGISFPGRRASRELLAISLAAP